MHYIYAVCSRSLLLIVLPDQRRPALTDETFPTISPPSLLAQLAHAGEDVRAISDPIQNHARRDLECECLDERR
jgi:hypothetical protein